MKSIEHKSCMSQVGLVSAVLLLAGCGANKLPVAPAGGVVTIDGRPLPSAYVTFMPSRGRAATAQTKADGSFALSTYGNSDGAIIDKHFVTVIARQPGQGETLGSPLVTRPGPSLIPERYGNTATSGLEYEVLPGKKNQYEIALVSKVHQ